MEVDQQTNHERVRRELWAAIYRQAHDQSAKRVQPEFRFFEQADYALAAFDRRFGPAGAMPVNCQQVQGARCPGLECSTGCVRTRGAPEDATTATPAQVAPAAGAPQPDTPNKVTP